MRGKIKYQGGITKSLCARKAALEKKRFLSELNQVRNLAFRTDEINFDIISFSGRSNLEDQLLSIFSFLFYAGRPSNWTIYSDGTYTLADTKFLTTTFNFLDVKVWNYAQPIITNEAISAYLGECMLAKKLHAIIGHQCLRQTIYLDSDIVFYNNISYYLKSALLQQGLWYSPDPLGDLSNFFNEKEESIYPLNSGFLILNDKFCKEDIYTYFDTLKYKFHYFSEQSSFEFAFRKQKADLLDPRQFIIDPSDQFDFAYKYHPNEIAMRHYTSPVRHKMWQKGWKWHFQPAH